MGDFNFKSPFIAMLGVLLTFLIVTNFVISLVLVLASDTSPSFGTYLNTLLNLSPCFNFIMVANKKPCKDLL